MAKTVKINPDGFAEVSEVTGDNVGRKWEVGVNQIERHISTWENPDQNGEALRSGDKSALLDAVNEHKREQRKRS